jgi:hypothetical protein
MRNKLAHSIRIVPKVKALRAYSAADAAWTFFKSFADNDEAESYIDK